MNKYFPNTLINIQNLLTNMDLFLTKNANDGRVNSAVNEYEVLNVIQTQSNFTIEIPKSRAWYDFSFQENEEWYPVNIKITETSHADNLNCKLAIYYVLTGQHPHFANEISWLKYFEFLKENIGKSQNKDYFYLIVNKNNTKDIFINSLSRVK